MPNKYLMRPFAFFCSLLFIGLSVFAQSKHTQDSTSKNQSAPKVIVDSLKGKTEAEVNKQTTHKKLFMVEDTLSASDYMMSIERVNDNLNSIRDSSILSFKVVGMSRRIGEISDDITVIRKNIRGRNTVVNIKNLYLYQNLVSNLDNENTRIQGYINTLYRRVYHAKLGLKTVLSDSIFSRMYADNTLRNTFDKRLGRLERKWMRADSTTRSNIDSLNTLKVKIADNSMSLSSMLNIMDNRLDRAGRQLFGSEVGYLWQLGDKEKPENDKSQKTLSILGNERNAIGYYFSQTSGERTIVFILGILLFIWLFLKRNLVKTISEQKESYSYLNLQYLNYHPVLSIMILLLCLMPFFDAYAPTSYIAIEYLLLLLASSVVFFKKMDFTFWLDWMALVILFIVDVLTYLSMEPTFVARTWLLAIYAGSIIFSYRFYRKLNDLMPYYKWIKKAVIIGMVLLCLGILSNVFGRFSLSGFFGIAAIFAVTQATILPIFIDVVIELILLQLHSSRLKKGINKPFDSSIVIKKIKRPLFIVAVLLWVIMLTSNLNIYHSISSGLVDFFTAPRTFGSISYKLISVLWFFLIIWVAHILQRLVGFLFGETGIETDDTSSASKEKHSRLLITKLLVLVGGYLLAVAASGLPIDKLTIILGALGVGIGMGLQNVVNNFVSGIILIFDGSLHIGDQIEVSGQAGKVKEIGLRASTLNTADGAEVIIPNGTILSQNITNWTFTNDEKRIVVRFALSGSELDANVINELINNTIVNIPDVISKRNPVILFTKVTRENCWLTVRFWSTISNADNVKSEAMLRLNTAFAAINIGFN